MFNPGNARVPFGAHHTFLKKLIYSDATLRLAFALGVAHSHGTLPETLFNSWIHFLVEDLYLITWGDTYEDIRYTEIEILLERLMTFVDGPRGPTKLQINEADLAAPKWRWIRPVHHEVWKYDVKERGCSYRRMEYTETFNADAFDADAFADAFENDYESDYSVEEASDTE